MRWDLRTGSKSATFSKCRPNKSGKGKGKERAGEADGHTDEVWALALSDDGKYLASAGKDRRVGIWNAREGKWVRGFGGHKDGITVRLLIIGPVHMP
jgi:ribosomal RNA-processing protein 9